MMYLAVIVLLFIEISSVSLSKLESIVFMESKKNSGLFLETPLCFLPFEFCVQILMFLGFFFSFLWFLFLFMLHCLIIYITALGLFLYSPCLYLTSKYVEHNYNNHFNMCFGILICVSLLVWFYSSIWIIFSSFLACLVISDCQTL